ncbi:MAG: glycosyltransferase family 4 protein [Candidatus Doudnabacteria bacterium]|nr:glycosyltransferase family 4 protein [Candidatus Doudnabacteria bacterium]
MRIAQLTSNFHKVSQQSTQAMYSHLGYLSNGLVDRGNDVTLFGSGDSESKARLFSVAPEAIYSLPEDVRKTYLHLLISKCYESASQFDIIHSHFTLLSSFYSGLVNTPTIISVHSPVDEKNKPFMTYKKDNNYVSFSLAQRRQMPDLNWVANIYHGVDTKVFQYNDTPQDYFLYLGRITEEKGVHFAIEAARAAGVPLMIAGRSYPQEGYWHEKMEKNIDGKMIRYVGEANFETKIEYLKNAKGLLFPTQYDEVFGLVMIEAMACGTPVIAWNKGSVPEVIQDGHTGYIVKDVEGMIKAISNIDKISREECRKRAELFFSVEKMVAGYEIVYMRVIEEHKKKMKAAKQ